jgi:acyl-coenzyme A thioesterase PaaI-like protein
MTYSLHILDAARDVRGIRVTRETVRRGRRIGFSRSLITDVDDPQRVIALTLGTGISLGDAPPGFKPVDLPPDLRDAPLPPLTTVFGARRERDGWRLPELTTRLASTSASLHLGPIHVVCEAAASEVAAAAAGFGAFTPDGGGPDDAAERGFHLQVEDWDIQFVAPGRRGPFLVHAEAWHSTRGGVLARFTLLDEGDADAVVASGAAKFGVVEQTDSPLDHGRAVRTREAEVTP